MLTSSTLNNRRQQRGITLIEVSIGLIIAAIIAAAAFIAFQNNSRRAEVRENATNIAEISSEVRTKFIRTNRAVEVETPAALQSANIFDPLGGQARNSYGGAVTFAEDAGVVTMSWAGVETDQCVDLVSNILSGGITTVTIGTTALTQVSTTANIQTACGTAPATLVITI